MFLPCLLNCGTLVSVLVTAVGLLVKGAASTSATTRASTEPNTSKASKAHLQSGGAKLFILGGVDIEPKGRLAEAFDFGSKTWSRVADMPTKRDISVQAAASGGLVYVLGGYSESDEPGKSVPLSSVDVYDPVTNKWSQTPNMTIVLTGGNLAALGDKLFLIGGWLKGDVVGAGEVYDVKRKSWSRISNMTVARVWHALAALDSYVYAIGGSDGGDDVHVSVEKYDPARNLWTPVAPMQQKRMAFCTAVTNGKLYAIGGGEHSIYNDVLDSVEVYDPKANTWSAVAAMSTARRGAHAVAFDGKLYVVGGFNGTVELDTIEVYDTKAKAWSLLSERIKSPRENVGVALWKQ